MDRPALPIVSIQPDGDRWSVVLNRPAHAETLRTFQSRDQAVESAGHLAEMLDLPLLAVGGEPEEAGR